MENIRAITSKENPQYRFARSLHDRRIAEREGVVFIEGVRLCEDALISGLVPQMILLSDEKITLAADWCGRFSVGSDTQILSMPEALFARLGSTKNPQGIAMVVPSPLLHEEIPVRGNDLYLVCEEISDPGNLGTMIRTADAFDFSAVLIVSGTVDPFNEKTIRSSMGSCFHIPVVSYNSIEEICFQLKKMNVQLVASHLNGEHLSEAEFIYPSALFVGNEARGLSDHCTSLCDLRVKIPMPGKAESLNASSAASILAYEMFISRK